MSNLIRMVYVSTSTNPVKESKAGIQVNVGRILMQARKNNPRHQIGGLLYFSNNYFFQCLEGGQEEVNRLYNKIAADPRHKNVQTVMVKHIEKRMFSNWSMKYVAVEDSVMQLLKANGFSSFRPYEFDDGMIEKMLGLFVQARDMTGMADQDYGQDESSKTKQGIFRRIFSLYKKKAA